MATRRCGRSLAEPEAVEGGRTLAPSSGDGEEAPPGRVGGEAGQRLFPASASGWGAGSKGPNPLLTDSRGESGLPLACVPAR